MSLIAQEKGGLVPSISVSGTGIINVVPDKAIIKLQVEHQGESASQTKKMVDEGIDGIIKFCRKKRIASNDVQSKRIQLHKNYNYQKKQYEFRASQAIHIVLRDLRDFDNLMEGLMDTGVNRIDGVQMLSTKQGDLMRKARIRAIQDAKQKAEDYAHALGQKVGKAITISEYSNPQPVYRAKSMAPMAESSGRLDRETLAVGELEIKTRISVLFELH